MLLYVGSDLEKVKQALLEIIYKKICLIHFPEKSKALLDFTGLVGEHL